MERCLYESKIICLIRPKDLISMVRYGKETTVAVMQVERIKKTGCVYVAIYTFGQPLQPVIVQANNPVLYENE